MLQPDPQSASTMRASNNKRTRNLASVLGFLHISSWVPSPRSPRSSKLSSTGSTVDVGCLKVQMLFNGTEASILLKLGALASSAAKELGSPVILKDLAFSLLLVEVSCKIGRGFL